MTRTARVVLVLVPLVLVAACSSSPSSAPSTVESSASELVAVGPPTGQWVPVDLEVPGAAIPPDGQRTVVIDGVPVLLRADPHGVVTDSATGWMRRVPTTQAVRACDETAHWAALAEEKYGLVSVDGPTIAESCRLSDLAAGEGTTISAECAPVVKGGDSTCIYLGADPVAGGQVRVTAIVVREHVPA